MDKIHSDNLEVRVLPDMALEFFDTERGERLLRVPGSRLAIPDFAKDATIEVAHAEPGALRLSVRSASLASGEVTVSACSTGFSIKAEYVPASDVELCRLDIFAPGTATACYHAHLFRHRHFTEEVCPEIVLGAEFDVNTYSCDWQYAPHPSAFLLSREKSHFFVGATCAPVGGFGVYLKGRSGRFETCHLDYGTPGWGTRIRAGEVWQAPEFRVFLDHGGDVFATYARFGELLAAEGHIPDPAKRTIVPWHREHVYCTWNDQGTLAASVTDAQVAARSEGRSEPFRTVEVAMNERLIRESAEKILREHLPIRTIILDEGWAYNRADYRADPRAFPNMRGLVDDLHAMGFKVVTWWTWAEARGADAERALGLEHCILGGKRNRHGFVMGDFSRKSTQEEYLKPMFRRFFSSEPDCYDFDGIKTDFQADKVHCDMPPDDPAWRGEENFFVHLYAFIFAEMRKYKPDAMHIGCSGDYFLAQYIDTNRTFDVFSDDIRIHINHARMVAATAPGALPAFDMHGTRSNWREYLRAAKAMGCPVHVGALSRMPDDMLSPATPLTSSDFELLRSEL